MVLKKAIKKHVTKGVGPRRKMNGAQQEFVKINWQKVDLSEIPRKSPRPYLEKKIIHLANLYKDQNPSDKTAKIVNRLPKSTYYDYLRFLGIPTRNSNGYQKKPTPNNRPRTRRQHSSKLFY